MAFLKDLIVLGASRFIEDAQGSKFIVDGATSSLFLKGDGTLDSNTYLTLADLVLPDWDQTDITSKDYIKNKPEIPNDYLVDYSKQYLTFEALENGTFQFTNAINYSIDGGITWVALTANTATPTITAGNKILWKAELIPSPSYPQGIGKFSSTGNFSINGNPMSLLFGDNFIGQTDLTGKICAFYELFYNCSKLINAKDLSLPATTLVTYCYYDMFQSCSNLTTAPELPATALANGCYEGMFNGCTSLTIAPNLSATILAQSCYYQMFKGCTALTAAPELPATLLIDFCYYGMFQNCLNLTTAPELPATILVTNCYNNMFQGCTNLNYIKAMFTGIPSNAFTSSWVNGVAETGTFIKNNNATWDVTGENGVPYNWNVYKEDKYKVVRQYELSDITSLLNSIISIDTKPKIIKSKLLNNKLKEVLIPIDSLKNNYNGDLVSKDVIIPYISDYQSYLVLEQGKILKNSSIIVEANLIGKGFYSNSSILTNNDLIQIYPTLPLNIIKDNLQYLIVTYYNDMTLGSNLFLWFDDFREYDNYDDWVTNKSETDAEDWQDYVQNYLLEDYPDYRGANCYMYTGETFEWEGKEYYLWESLRTGEWSNVVSNILTDTIDYEELYSHSLEVDYTNSWCPYIIKFDTKTDMEPYDNEQGDILIKVILSYVIQDTWIYIENRFNNKNYEDWDDYCTNYLLNLLLENLPNCYEYTGETIEWNGNNYYLWYDENHDLYIITDTINYNELYNESIESDHYNMICPYVAMLDTDTELMYEQSERKYDWLVKVIEDNNNPGQAKQLYIDDFIRKR